MSLSRKPLLLDEVDEHQPVEHHRGVPLAVVLDRDALDERQEAVVLLLEAVVELLRHPVDVEARPEAAGDVGQGEQVLFGEIESYRDEFLNQCLPGLSLLETLLARLRRFAVLVLDPLPDQLGLAGVGKDDRVLVLLLADLTLDLLPILVVRDLAIRPRATAEGDVAALFGDRPDVKFMAVEGDVPECLAMIIPAKFLDEQVVQLKFLEALADAFGVHGHGISRPLSGRGVLASR